MKESKPLPVSKTVISNALMAIFFVVAIIKPEFKEFLSEGLAVEIAVSVVGLLGAVWNIYLRVFKTKVPVRIALK